MSNGNGIDIQAVSYAYGRKMALDAVSMGAQLVFVSSVALDSPAKVDLFNFLYLELRTEL